MLYLLTAIRSAGRKDVSKLI